MPRKRSGSSCVLPWMGENTDMPNRIESPRPNLPGAKFSVKVVAVLEKVTSAGVRPCIGPGLKRFGLALQLRPMALVSKVTDRTVRAVKGCKARPKYRLQRVQSPLAVNTTGPAKAAAHERSSGSGMCVAVCSISR